MFSRRSFLQRLMSLAAVPGAGMLIGRSAFAAETASRPNKRGRVIILGFDGVEPTILEKMLSAGELPNLAKLRDQGSYQRLLSAYPPQSPTAWSSFATSMNAGGHGIYDFIRRNPKNYIPDMGFGRMQEATLAPDGAVSKPAEFINFRKGQTFWSVASAHGAPCKILMVPYATPAEDLENGLMLCGLDIPDIRGTQSTYFSLSDQYTEMKNVAGGVELPLRFQGDTATISIPGLRNPRVRKSFIEAPLNLTVDRQAHTATVEVQGKTVNLAAGKWSGWLEWTFQVTPSYAVRAVSRFWPVQIGEHVRIYMTCLQVHPKAPMLRISTPPEYAGQVADRYGLHKTVGWAYDTKALQHDAITEDAYIADENETMDWHARLTLDEIKAGDFELLIAGWTGTDRAGHMFWRFRDPKHPHYTPEGAQKYGHVLEDTYIKMDAIVGQTVQSLAPDDLLIVMSDHGLKSFRRAFSVNTWLARNGYLTVKGQFDPAFPSTDVKYLQGIDWSKTKAYSLGFGSIFLNRQGREGKGIVTPEEAPALLAEIRDKLLTVTDTATGDKIFSAVQLQSELFHGPALADAPDIGLGYADGYQTDKQSAAGAVPKELVSDNADKWSAEHAAVAAADAPGILFSNKTLKQNAAIVDLGPTALAYLDVPIPQAFEGRPLL